MRLTSIFMLVCSVASVCSGQAPAVVKSAVAPHYPPIAVASRVTGTVSIRVHIDTQGTVTSAGIVDGPKLLRLGVEDTAKLWRFEPEAVERDRTATLKFVYILLPETADAAYEVKFVPSYEVIIEKHPAKQSVNYGATHRRGPGATLGGIRIGLSGM